MLLLVPLALAHPGASPNAPGALRDYLGHRLYVEVGDEAVQVRYVAEVPERLVLAEARLSGEPGYGERLLEQLAGEIRLTWDGAPLPATRLALDTPVQGGEVGFLEFSAGYGAALPAASGRLGVRNGNFPDLPAFFATEVTLAGRWMADASSLLRVHDGRARDNWHGAWVKDERSREPWVELRAASWLERQDAPAPLPERTTGLRSAGPPWWVHALAVAALVPIGALGRWLGRRARAAREGSAPPPDAASTDGAPTDAASTDAGPTVSTGRDPS